MKPQVLLASAVLGLVTLTELNATIFITRQLAPVNTNLFTAFGPTNVVGTIVKTNVTHENKRGVKITYGIDLQRRK